MMNDNSVEENRNSEQYRKWLFYAAFTLGAVLLYFIINRSHFLPGLENIVLLCLLQVIAIRIGKTEFLWSNIIAFAIIAALTPVFSSMDLNSAELAPIRDKMNPVLTNGIPLFFLGSLQAGLIFMNFFHRPNLRKHHKLLAASYFSGLLAIVVTFITLQNSQISQDLKDLSIKMIESLFENGRLQLGQIALDIQLDDVKKQILDLIWMSIITQFMFLYFLMLSAAYWLGSRFGLGRNSGITGIPPVLQFRVNSRFIWPLIVSLAFILMNIFINMFIINTIAINTLLIVLTLYGIQGMGILKYWITKYNIPRNMKMIMVLGFIMMILFIPEMNLILMILLPGLGIAETWIKIRKDL
ncbi:MAG: DUF2232 domain-containing protein [Spirochaetales bacterium]|nr:DUF2232 domain-containing protein [Spirochaetales bacterium]